MTQPALVAERTAPSGPLVSLPDQPERWIAHQIPVSFDHAVARVLEACASDGDRDDVVVHDLRSYAFGSSEGRTMALARVPLPGRDAGRPLPLRDLAFSQLCARLGAPASYVRTLPAKLQIACMNWALANHRAAAMLRLAGSEVRAVVSDRYAAIDHHTVLEILDAALTATGFREDASVRAVAVGPSMVLRLTLPGEAVAVRAGDVIEYGIDIGNSELGLRSVQVTPVTYRLVCTNGMRAWKSEAALRMRHVGDPDRLHEQLRDAIPVAFAEARGDIERWRKAVDVLVDDALEEVESLRRVGLTSGEAEDVGRELVSSVRSLPARTSAASLEELLKETRGISAFEVANAITAVARDREAVHSRLSLEEAAHRYLAHRTR